ncbi:sensor histidine kinase [Agromyces protaetiae]
MALGLPEHLARDALSHALGRAGQAAAFVCLAVATTTGIANSIQNGAPDGAIVAACMAAMAALLALVAWRPSISATIAYLVVGTGAVVYATAVVMASGVFPSANNAVLSLPLAALLLVGGAGTGTVLAILWAVLGYVLGQLATLTGCLITGTPWALNAVATFALAILLVVRTFDGLARRANARGETRLNHASRTTRELALRHESELRATARLHDTALVHLVAIAAAGSGEVDERIRAGIRQDFALIIGRNWASDHVIEEPASRRRLANALQTGANAGVEVRVSGDLDALALVSDEAADALDQAIAQCLVNIGRHAGTNVAELAIGAGGGEVTVAVLDEGIGFDVEAVPSDRIGLRTSIRWRIEQVGGTVRLWSTRGVGTTIVLTVPVVTE